MNEAGILGSNINRVKAHNLRAVLLHLLFQETAYRVELAEKTSLSTTTITNIIDDLIGMGIASEIGIEAVEGPRRVGRPRAALRLEKNARYVLAVQMGVERYRLGVVNLKGEILASRRFTFPRLTPAADVLEQIAPQLEDLLVAHDLDRARVLGVGVGAAGLVNYQTGVNILSANMGWENVPFQATLSDRLSLPVVVDNNVKCMALGEAFFGLGRNVGSLAFVYGRTGVGSGIVIGNRLLRGADLGAGEIGHMILRADGGARCRCGQCGCLETLISELALTEQTAALVAAHPASDLARRWQAAEANPVELLFAAARQGDAAARAVVEEASRYLGIALANLVNLLNPELIVLGGLFAEGQDVILPMARQTLAETAFAGLGKKVRLQATGFGVQAGVVGAGALALTNFFYLNPEEQ
jgi:predicted NBD/HSP70 family sugar kinase